MCLDENSSVRRLAPGSGHITYPTPEFRWLLPDRGLVGFNGGKPQRPFWCGNRGAKCAESAGKTCCRSASEYSYWRTSSQKTELDERHAGAVHFALSRALPGRHGHGHVASDRWIVSYN